MELSVVIPASNEEKRIKGVLENYSSYFFKKLKDRYEIIVVANGCKDKTVEIVRKFTSKNQKIICLEFPEKLGKGKAIKEGFKAAQGKFLGFVDCDESVAPQEFEKLFLTLRESNWDGLIASRKIKGSKIITPQPLERRVASRMFNILVRVMFGLPFKDTQCGAKIFKKEIIKKIIPQIKSNGYEFDVELLWKIKKGGHKIKELPILWKHQENSKFNLGKNSLTILMGLIKLKIEN